LAFSIDFLEVGIETMKFNAQKGRMDDGIGLTFSKLVLYGNVMWLSFGQLLHDLSIITFA